MAAPVGFVAAPYVFTTLDAARNYSEVRDGYCSYFLVAARPGVPLKELQARIAERLPDADVFLSEEIAARSRDYWMLRTGIGVSFGTATILGLLVGLVMVAQSLYALALDHLTDYATLKAIGYDDGFVVAIILQESLILALLAFGPSFLLSLGLYGFLARSTSLMVVMTAQRAVLVFLFTLAMCGASGWLATSKLRRLDPAEIF